jgi:tetratricopeptide (TPR) repeat protein
MTRGLKLFGSILVILVLCAPYIGAQDKISPVSDYQFKKDYAQYENIHKEADVQKRADLCVAFMKEHPISKALSYIATDYMEAVKPHINNKDWAKVVAMEEAFIAMMPTEKSVKDANVPEPGAGEFLKGVLAPTMKSMYSAVLAAYYQSNNLPKAAEIGEKMYAAGGEKEMAGVLADIYLKLQNFDKYLQFGEKILAEYPIEQSYGTALQMAQVYLQKQDANKAKELYTKVMDTYGDKVPQGVQESAWNATRAMAYGIFAAGSYAQKDYPKTIELYTKVAGFDKMRDDAYYYMGMCKWQSKEPDAAIDYFAKAAVLNKQFAKRAQDYLGQLWQARHPENPAGVEEAKTKAKSDLGLK